MKLAEDQEHSGIHVHHGFYEGARQHADAIVSVIQQSNREAGRVLPVWVSGHSLGGAYANCVMLHLLESCETSRLFEAGAVPCHFHTLRLDLVSSNAEKFQYDTACLACMGWKWLLST